MIGIFLLFLAAATREAGIVLGKDAVAKRVQTIYANSFLAVFSGMIFFGIIVIVQRETIVFDPASIPMLVVRIFLETALLIAVTKAVLVADRTTMSFFRTMTIPLLLAVDLILGYAISTPQLLGIGLIIILLIISFLKNTLSRNGLIFVIFASLLPVCTATAYKFNIENYNSVAIEQFIVLVVLLLVTIAMTHYVSRESIFHILHNRRSFVQSFVMGGSSVLISYALIFVNPAVAFAAKRSFGVIIATFSGLQHYHEGHRGAKVLLTVGMICGIILLAF